MGPISHNNLERVWICQVPVFDVRVGTGDYSPAGQLRNSGALNGIASFCECRAVAVDADNYQIG